MSLLSELTVKMVDLHLMFCRELKAVNGKHVVCTENTSASSNSDKRSFPAINARFVGNGTFDMQPNGCGLPRVTSQEEVTVRDVISGNPDTSKRRVATCEGTNVDCVYYNYIYW